MIRRFTVENKNDKNNEYQGKGLLLKSKAFKLFKQVKKLADVAITLDMETDKVLWTLMTIFNLLNCINR
jgi:hypothetical protein